MYHSVKAQVNLPKDCIESICCISKNIGREMLLSPVKGKYLMG